MRLASVVLAACVAGFAASDSSADDAAPKAEAAKPLRLRLKTGKTYLYRLHETLVIRPVLRTERLDGTAVEERADVIWDAGVSLQRTETGGDSIVSLTPTRVRGTITDVMGKPETFDTEDPKSRVTSPLLGRELRVRLSPRGRVLAVADPGAVSPAVGGPELRVGLERQGAEFARPFAEQFFHEVSKHAPEEDGEWEQSRALPPEWVLWDREKEVRGRCLGDVTEKSVVQSVSAEAITATVRARGKSEVPRRDEPVALDAMRLADLVKLGDQLDEWLVLGEVRIRRDSGLVVSRTATYTIKTHRNPVRVSKQVGQMGLGVVAEPEEVTPIEHTHEIKLQLDLLDVR
jgi:hypothetical protein